jgi:DNA-binding LacI/PurR family transcriptional regulator
MVDEPAQAAQLVETWRSSRRPEGVFGFDDAHSGLLLGALNDAGVRVPQELALVGADDQQLCDMLRPRLSSVAIAMDNFRAFAEPVVSAIRGKWTQGVVSERWPAVLKQRET